MRDSEVVKSSSSVPCNRLQIGPHGILTILLQRKGNQDSLKVLYDVDLSDVISQNSNSRLGEDFFPL
jgi:hypothetical protein